MNKILITFVFILFSLPIYSTIRNVPGSYSTIQAAINASVNGDTVLVEQGTYMENINFRGKKIVVTSRYYISNNPAIIENTVINGSTPVQPDSASCVIISSGEDTTTVLQGFTLIGGKGTKWQDEHGAGRYTEGGGILIAYSSPIIQNNIIKFNEAVITGSGVTSAGGGGIRLGDGNPRILNNVIMFNKGLYGAGIVVNYSGVIIKNNLIYGNFGSTSYGSGAGIWINNNLGAAPKIIENNTIANNSASAGTGGVNMFSGTNNVILRNNIIWGNIPSAQILGGSPSVVYCDVQGGYSGAGNMDVNPMFADTNYILSANSPCVDKGDSSTVYNDRADSLNPTLARYPSRGTIRNDMGAYGGPKAGIFSYSLIGVKPNQKEIPSTYKLNQNYPNPFNPSTVITYNLPKAANVKITVFDVTGKEITRLVDSYIQAGEHEIVFNANNYASGIYFYRLESLEFSDIKKMLLIK
ncbi:MAG: T9SS C-terminal target domain-containing protein [Ignavibacteriae bacterium]|nr:MAG: T9SS C-terminal target domain-containing protein [Ignavibacteriota bacterium]